MVHVTLVSAYALGQGYFIERQANPNLPEPILIMASEETKTDFRAGYYDEMRDLRDATRWESS